MQLKTIACLLCAGLLLFAAAETPATQAQVSTADTPTINDITPATDFPIYFDNREFGWKHVYAYIYSGDEENPRAMSSWPGTEMTKISGSNLYYLDVGEFAGIGYVIFTDGADPIDNRVPSDLEPGYAIGDESMIFSRPKGWIRFYDTDIGTDTDASSDSDSNTESDTDHGQLEYDAEIDPEAMTLTVNTDDELIDVRINGNKLHESFYSVSKAEGKTVITFSEDAARLLPDGTHTITANFTNGTVDINYTVLNPPIRKYVFGDINDDGEITSSDALFILRTSAGLEEETSYLKLIADVDGDGEIQSSDALAILRHSAGMVENDRIGTFIEVIAE